MSVVLLYLVSLLGALCSFPFLFENLPQLLSYYVAAFERAEGGTAVSHKALLTSSVNVANVKTSFLYVFCRDFLKE